MIVAEVIETKYAYKPNQKDDDGNILPLGSIEIRIGSNENNLGQVRNIYARPATFNRRIPLIGEQVLVLIAPTNDWSSSGMKGNGYLYYSPVNTTDDLTLHQFPRLWKRKASNTGKSAGLRKSDKEIPGYTFPKNPKKTYNVQPFEGDDLFEGRFGQSIRFGSTVIGDMSIYDKKPNWKGAINTDPILLIRIAKPSSGISKAADALKRDRAFTNKYTIEDISKDNASIYLTSTQSIPQLKAGFDKNLDSKMIGNWKSGSQIILNSDRIVLNAVKNKLLLIGKEQVIVTGKKLLFQTDKFKVDLDTLMEFLKNWIDQDKNLAMGSAQYMTAAGPTATATNVAQYIKLSTIDYNKFKLP
jgi:hypothetical protein